MIKLLNWTVQGLAWSVERCFNPHIQSWRSPRNPTFETTKVGFFKTIAFLDLGLVDRYGISHRSSGAIKHQPHISGPPSKIPKEIIDGLIKSLGTQTQATLYLNLVHHGLYDLMAHSPPNHETTKTWNLMELWNSNKEEVMLLDRPEVWGESYMWGFSQAEFSKLITSYDVGFYSCPWCDDMARINYSGILSPARDQWKVLASTGQWLSCRSLPGGFQSRPYKLRHKETFKEIFTGARSSKIGSENIEEFSG